MFVYCFFFFFKQKTAYEMRISDWSSDVCSSDLVLADGDVADEADIVGQRHAFVPPRDTLDRLVIGCDPRSDQAKGHRQPIDDVDADAVAEGLLTGFGGVIARRPRSDHRDVPHTPALRSDFSPAP